MKFLLLLLLLSVIGGVTYFSLKQNVAPMTKTPLWILWLVLMVPPFVLSGLMLVIGEKQPLPPGGLLFIIGLFFLCFFFYQFLIQQGRTQKQNLPAETDASEGKPVTSPKTDPPKKLNPITSEEEKLLRNCFPWGTYYLQNLDYHPQAILCRGKLRSQPEVAYKTIRHNIEDKFGDRFIIIFQEGARNSPFFALVPNPWAKKRDRESNESLTRPLLALALFAITLFTTTLAGAEMAGVSPQEWQADATVLLRGVPYSLALVGILGLRELSHYFAAVRYRVRSTLPYFIPIPLWLGTLGAFIQMRSPVPHRKALFDIAIAGPLVGFLLALPTLFWGLSHSTVVPLNDESSMLNPNSLNPRFSLLMALASKLALGDRFTLETAIHLNPVAVAGYLGLAIVALNLMPVGQLEGGRIVHAMFGQRTAAVVGQIARILMLVLALIQQDFLIWAIILLFLPIADEPALNDVTELDNWRDGLGLLALALLLPILLPVPGMVAQWLNI